MDDTGRNGTGDADHAPPHDLDTERSLLGAMLIDPGAVGIVAGVVGAGDFYTGQHRAIFEAMLAAVNNGGAVDTVQVGIALKGLDLYDVAGGSAYLAELLEVVPTSFHAAHYARIVADKAGLRRIIQAGGAMVRAAHLPAAEVAPILRDAAASLETVDRAEPLAADTLDWKDGVFEPARKWLIKDYLPAGRVALFSGAGGAGKSRLALQLGAAIAAGAPAHWLPDAGALKAGGLADVPLTSHPNRAAPVVFASYEDEPAEARRRLRRLAAGSDKVDGAGGGALAYAEPSARGGRLHYLDLSGAGPIWGPAYAKHIETRAGPLAPWHRVTKFAAHVGARLLIIDPSAGAFGSSENDRAAVREFVSALDRWAREHDCAVLLISHPPKPAPRAKTARYSGSTDWRNAARTVWTLEACAVEGCAARECKCGRRKGKGEAKCECKCGRLVLVVDKASYVKAPRPVHVAALWRDAGGAWAQADADVPYDDEDDDDAPAGANGHAGGDALPFTDDPALD